jgi:mannose-1-phosphate guanylyltransferase
MSEKPKRIVFIDSDNSFLEKLNERLAGSKLDEHLFTFTNYDEALEFIKQQLVQKNKKPQYVLINANKKVSSVIVMLERMATLKEIIKHLEVIVSLSAGNKNLKDKIMRHPVVTACTFNSFTHNYIEFLITGKAG